VPIVANDFHLIEVTVISAYYAALCSVFTALILCWLDGRNCIWFV